jgi:hypothetical protein
MLSPDDRLLLDQVRAAAEEHDPVPAHVVAAAKASFTWRTIDAELAELVDDSVLTGASVRTADGPRMLTFEAGDTTVVVEILDSGTGRQLTGQLISPRPAQVEVRWQDGHADTVADDLGRFLVDGVPAGPVSLACRFPLEDRPPLVTSWVTI